MSTTLITILTTVPLSRDETANRVLHKSFRPNFHGAHKTRMSPPPASTMASTSKPPPKRTKHAYAASEFERLGSEIMNRKQGGSQSVFVVRYVSFFGVDVTVTVHAWKILQADVENDPDLKKVQTYHLLWGLMFLKLYGLETEMAALAGGVDEQTFRYWSHLVVEKISYTVPEVVSP